MGIPKAPPCRPKSPPGRPQPPNRPPLPTTPKQAPKAGVISIVKADGQIRPVSAGDPNVSAAPSIPHRPAPPVALAKAYQDTTEQKRNLSRKSSSSSSSSPVEESEQKQSPPAQSLVIHDQDTGAIYEEINDDIVSRVFLCMITNICLRLTLKFFILQYIPKPRDPPPPLPQDSVYDLDVNPNKSNTASPSRVAPSPPGRPQPPAPNAMATPPPLPRRQNAAPNAAAPSANELPKVPARSGAPPPLPARPNSQM